MMKLNIAHLTETSPFWNKVNILAKEAFPPEEYLAPSELVKMAQADNFDFLALLEGDVNFIFVMTIRKQVCFCLIWVWTMRCSVWETLLTVIRLKL